MEVPASLTNLADPVVAALPTVGLTVGLGVAFYAVIVWLGERADRKAMERLVDEQIAAEVRLADLIAERCHAGRVIYTASNWHVAQPVTTSFEQTGANQ